jgi:hypothetical protein
VEQAENGRAGNLHEVVDLEHGRRAVTRSLASVYPSWGALTIEPLGPDACRLTQEFWADIPAGVSVGTVQSVRQGYRDVLRRMMGRLTELAPQSLT